MVSAPLACYHYLPPWIPSAKLLRCCYCTSKCHLLTVCTVLYSAMFMYAASSECTCSNVATAAKDPSCEGSALTPQISFSLAAFLTVYSPRYTYYGVSSGYMDGDFPWHKEFDRDYGAPLENATDRGECRAVQIRLVQ